MKPILEMSPAEAREEAERRTLVFVLPLPLNIANARLHWRTKLAHRQRYDSMLDVLQQTDRVPHPPRIPFASATIAAHLAVGNPMDDDNAMSRCKWAIDWLVTRGYVSNDTRKVLTWSGLPTQAVDRKSPSLTLTLTPRGDPRT